MIDFDRLSAELNLTAKRIGWWRELSGAIIDRRQAREPPMAGEIRNAMAGLRLAKEGMIRDLLKEIASVHTEVAATRTDGIDALKLPRAELDLTKQEIREIREEFAPKTNGAPNASPLPGAQAASSQTSGASGTSPDTAQSEAEKKT